MFAEPPGQPSVPVLSSRAGQLSIAFDGLNADGEPMDWDTEQVLAHVGSGVEFQPDGTTLVGVLAGAGSMSVSWLDYGDEVAVRFVARNQDGALSRPSAAAVASIVQVGTGDLADGSVTVGKLDPDIPIPSTDGDPPGSAPVVGVVPGPGWVVARWDEVPNADPVWYDVFVGDVSGFARDEASFVTSTQMLQVWLRSLPDGTPLPVDADSFVVVRARDADGDGPDSAEVAVRPVRVGVDDLDQTVLDQIDAAADEAAAAQQAAADAQSAADAAQQAADDAAAEAAGKGKFIASAVEPPVEDRDPANLWVDLSGMPPSNTPKRWDGSAWVAVTDQVAVDAAQAALDAAQAAAVADGKAVVAQEQAADTAVKIRRLIVGDFTNLLVNGDFEAGTAGWTLDGSVGLDTEHFESGTQAMGLSGTGMVTSDPVDVAADRVVVEVSSMLVVEDSEGKVWVGLVDGSGVLMDAEQEVPLSSAWSRDSFEFVTPDAVSVRLRVRAELTAGQVTVDNLLVRVASGGELLVDGTVTARKVAADVITVNEAYAKDGYIGTLAVDQLMGGEMDAEVLVTGTFRAGGEDRNSMSFSPDGFRLKRSDGRMSIWFPLDADQANLVDGALTARGFTSLEKAEFRSQASLATGSRLTAEVGIVAPTVQMNATSTWWQMQVPVEVKGPLGVRGVDRSGGLWWVQYDSINSRNAPIRGMVLGFDDDGVVQKRVVFSDDPSGPDDLVGGGGGGEPRGGVVVYGDVMYVLYSLAGSWWVTAVDLTVSPPAPPAGWSDWEYDYHPASDYWPTMGRSDDGCLVVAQTNRWGNVYVRKMALDSRTMVEPSEVMRQWGSYNPLGAYWGAGDWSSGEARIALARNTEVNLWHVTGGTADSTLYGGEGWWSANNSQVAAFCRDVEGGRFVTVSDTGVLSTYSHIVNSGGDTDDWWVAPTWRDADGHETPLGDPSRWTQMRRSSVVVSLPTPPEEADRVGVYVARGAAVPPADEFHLTATSEPGQESMWLDVLDFTGAAPPAVTTFPDSVPAVIDSRKGGFWVDGRSDGEWPVVAPVGEVKVFGGSVVPYGYVLCDGRLLSRVTYPRLFATIGTAWGAGDGTSTFAVPDLRSRFLMGAGAYAGLGETDGRADTGLGGGRSPEHQHTNGRTGTSGSHRHIIPGQTPGSRYGVTAGNASDTIYWGAFADHNHGGTVMPDGAHDHSVPSTDANVRGSIPFACLSFIIRAI